MNLIVINTNYPSKKNNAEYNLLNEQLKAIEGNFEKIFLIPTGEVYCIPKKLQNSYKIFKDFRSFQKLNLFSFSIYFLSHFKYLLKDVLGSTLNKFLKKISISLASYTKAIYFFTYLKQLSSKNNIDLSKSLIYSFWFDDFTFGALLIKNQFPKCKIISGAHGYDLYPSRRIGNRIPFRKISITLIDYVLTDSEEGMKFLKREYSKYSSKIIHLNSGVVEKKMLSNPSKDDALRIMTLSRPHPIKRIDYLLKLLKEIEDYCDFNIYYSHIGTGEELKDIYKLIKKLNFKKFKINLLGGLDNIQLKNFFENKYIDVFLNVSSSEGTSMALIEALSYAIPILVTDVGGNKTIGEYCETLLPLDFSANDLFKFFKKIHYDKAYRDKLGKLSYSYWSKNHDSKMTKREINKVFKEIATIK